MRGFRIPALDSEPPRPSGPCSDSRCHLCRSLMGTKKVKSTSYGDIHNCKNSGTHCNSGNVVYCIQCLDCDKQYVGSTTLPLRQRINNHKSCIRRAKNGSLQDTDCFELYRHLAEHSDGQFRLMILEEVTPATVNRIIRKRKLVTMDPETALRKVERDWITDLGTVTPMGLNMNNGKGSQFRKKRKK